MDFNSTESNRFEFNQVHINVDTFFSSLGEIRKFANDSSRIL